MSPPWNFVETRRNLSFRTARGPPVLKLHPAPTPAPIVLPIRSFFARFGATFAILVAAACWASPASGQSFTAATDLLNDSAAGLVVVQDMPALCAAWQRTNLAKLGLDEDVWPLLEENFGSEGKIWERIGGKVGVRPKDLVDLATGEAAIAWLPYPNDTRRPSAIAVIADIRGNQKPAQDVLQQIDAELKQRGATRQDVTRAGRTIRVYRPKRKPGQLKIEQIVLMADAERLIATDRDELMLELIDAIAAGGTARPISKAAELQTVWQRSNQRLAGDVDPDAAGPDSVRWFVRPLLMARTVRDLAQVDRGNKVRIVDLLQRQGFGVLRAAGGVMVLGGEQYDLIHRGDIDAPAVAGAAGRYPGAAAMLQFPAAPVEPLPPWVPTTTSSITQVNWKLQDAFWAAEPLVDDLMQDAIFRQSIDGIRDDQDGPQIDIEKNVLPSMDDRLLILTDTTEPVTATSDRMAVAIGLSNAPVMAASVAKAMRSEPDVTLVRDVPGVDIWHVQRGGDDDLSDLVGGDFDDLTGFDDEAPREPPLLDTWALAVIKVAGPAAGPSSYLVFASDLNYLIELATRMKSTPAAGFGKNAQVTSLAQNIKNLSGNQTSITRIALLDRTLRAKYELFRRGELKDSGSVLSAIVRRISESAEQNNGQPVERLDTSRWPEFSKIEPYLKPFFSYVRMTPEGYEMNGFLTK